jgi:DNA helicase-2/ATP-dependent DNA helicase PcrA
MHRSEEEASELPENISFGDVAILYRLHALSGPLEETLSREGIPYQRYGERSLRGQTALEALTATLRWLADPRRDGDLLQSLGTASVGLSDNTVEIIREMSLGEQGALWEKLTTDPLLPSSDPSEAKRLQRQLRSLANLLDESRRTSTSHVIRRLTAVLRMRIPASSSTWDPSAEILKGFLASAELWQGDLLSFLDLWTVQDEGDLYDPRADRVALMSVHAAKGLEFPVVFLVGCEEGLFPHLPDGGEGDVEEERRLFFVAVTRARDLLYLTRTRSRTLWGRKRELGSSRFLRELPPTLVRCQEVKTPSHTPSARQLKLFR